MDGPRSPGLAVLREKLNEPDVATALTRLLDRIDDLESSVTKLTQLVEAAPAALAAAGDVADEAVRSANARGVDVEARIRAGLSLLERLSEPKLQTSLARLIDAAEHAQGAVAMMGDIVDDSAQRLDLAARLQSGGALVERATRPETVDQLGEMLEILLEAESGMLNVDAVRALNLTAQSLIAARARPPERVSLWQALRAAREPEVQKALGFLLEVARQLGTRIDGSP